MAVEAERLSGDAWAPPWVRHEHMARYLFACDVTVGRLVIDCACGDGTSTRLLSKRSERVWGFDLAEAIVEKSRAANDDPNVSYGVADASALPLPDGAANAYVSLETIEHLPDEVAFLDEVVRVLDRRDGIFVCSTPDRDVYSPGNGPTDQPWNQFHLREYNASEFGALLRRFFEVVELYGQNPKSNAVTMAKHSLASRISMPVMVRVNQAFKLPRLIHDSLDRHRVRPTVPGKRYEYLVAVCRTPIRGHGSNSGEAVNPAARASSTAD